MVHHKFCIIDESLVATGSYNWTYYAENRNWENIVLISREVDVGKYIDEFKRLTDKHEIVKSISESRISQGGINSNQILEQDYLFQLKTNKFQDIIKQASLLDAITKVNPKNSQAENERAKVVQSLIQDELRVIPFEVGIHYKNGYSALIPAFSELPIKVIKTAKSIMLNQKNVKTTVQLFHKRIHTIIEFNVIGIKPKSNGVTIVEHTLEIDTTGLLTVSCNELGGFGKREIRSVNLKQYIK
jgi:hypothetical protein